MLLDGCDDKRAPIELLHDKFPATCLISAGNDELVPKKQTHDFFHALQDLGVQARLVEWAEGTHGFTFDGKNDQGSECWNTVTRPACDFVIAKTRR
jgi:acetyl esterase/lipase